MIRPARRYWIFFGIVFVVALAASLAFIAKADRDSDDTLGADDKAKRPPITRDIREAPLNLDEAEIREVVDVIQLYSLEKELGLDETQLTRVLPKWRKIMDSRREFWSGRKKSLDAAAALLDEYRDGAATEADLTQALTDLRNEDAAFWSSYRKQEDAILAELTPEQRLRYIVLDSRQPRQTGRLLRAIRRINAESDSASTPDRHPSDTDKPRP